MRREHRNRDRRGGDECRREPAGPARVHQLGAGRVPGDETGGQGREEEVRHLGDHRGGVHGQDAEERSENDRVQRWVVDRRGCARQVRVDVAGAVREGAGEAGVEPVVVEDSDERVVQGQQAGDEGDPGRGEAAFYFRRQSPRGGRRL